MTDAHAETRKLMVFGDSLVAGYGLPVDQSFPAQLEKKLKAEGYDITVINAGVSGDTTSGGVTRLDWVLEQSKPDAVIVVLGGNDMLRSVDVKVTRENLDKIVKTLKAKKLPVLLAGMQSYRNLSAPDDGFNKIYGDIAKQNKVALYPFFLDGVALDQRLNQADGVHPNNEGVGIIVEKILPSVKDLLKER